MIFKTRNVICYLFILSVQSGRFLLYFVTDKPVNKSSTRFDNKVKNCIAIFNGYYAHKTR